MKSFKQLLKNQVAKPKRVDDQVIFDLSRLVLAEEFGNIGRNKIKPSFFKEGRLFLETESSAWAQEIWLQKEILKKKINNKIGENVVKEIKLK